MSKERRPKFWPGADVRLAPPPKDRPRCRACGRRLKPVYNDAIELRYVDRSTGEVFRRHELPAGPINSNRFAFENRKTRMIWKGTYGWLGRDRFCGLNCAAYWAAYVVVLLDRREEVIYTVRARAAMEGEQR